MNIYKRTTSLASAIALSSICISISAQAAVPATLTTYTNRTLWEAAVISAGFTLQTEDFNSFNAQPISASSLAGIDNFQRQSLALPSVGLSLFHANTTEEFDDNVVHVGPGEGLNIDGTNLIRVDDNPDNLQITVSGVSLSAFAFDYKGYGGSGEGLNVTINGNIEYLGDIAVADPNEADPAAFFGFVDTDANNVYTLFQTTGIDGAIGLDNLSVGRVPEPSSSILLSIAGLFLIGKRKR
ncbi:PEP-CTERM sorting domain-containing protein [Rubritalea sp.]|uniref:PEP-CTERM sorting domain-containing protein n=1 Tax=Rubritalea sp. TaxID=2109375 RepID=UPI003EF11FAB